MNSDSLLKEVNPSKEGERKILAILFSDIKGYSKLMGENEGLALQLLEEHNKLVLPRIEKGGGKVLKMIGDAVLASFGSALEAVTTAMRVQDALHQRNQAYPEGEKILIRIGIHVGDVLIKDNDVFGDGVNIAARLEPLARPGGICVSQMVRDMLQANPQIILESMGEKELKNIRYPVHVYHVGTTAQPVLNTAEALPTRPPETSAKGFEGKSKGSTKSGSQVGKENSTNQTRPAWKRYLKYSMILFCCLALMKGCHSLRMHFKLRKFRAMGLENQQQFHQFNALKRELEEIKKNEDLGPFQKLREFRKAMKNYPDVPEEKRKELLKTLRNGRRNRR